MNRIALVILTAFSAVLLSSCGRDNFKIEGTAKGQQGKTVFLQRFHKGMPQNIDSTVIGTDGNFTLETKLPNLDYYQLFIDPQNTLVFVGDTVGELKFVAEDGLKKPGKFEGQEDTKILYKFDEEMQAVMMKGDSIIQLGKAGMPEDQVLEKLNAFNKTAIEFLHNYVDKNQHSPAALAGLNKMNPVIDLPYFRKVYDGLKVKMAKSEYLDFLKMQIERAGQQAEIMKKQEAAMAENDKLLPVGSAAPAISLKDPAGKTHSLNDFKGKIVLVDFWASWCGPCRKENPNVVKLYNQYHSKGLEIFSVSLDKNPDAWKRAIVEDGLNWTHVSDLKDWQSAPVAAYSVQSVPFTVLLDRDGKIIAKNLRGAQLAQKLKELLG